MKLLSKMASIKAFVTILILTLIQTFVFGQDSGGGSSTVTTTTHTETQTWYAQPWVWIVGAAVFILLLIALVRGGWTGVGLGAGRAKWNFLPAAHTDFIFAVIGEELGVLGCALVVGLFVLIAVIGFRTAHRAPDRFGTVLAVGATTWIVGQAILNLGAVVGVLPVTGVPLPFVSFGGTALVSTMVAAGVLVNVARQGARAAAPETARAGVSEGARAGRA